ncbi:piggyBac transposable element-derived protein 4 [Trichonephila inaurata madagascariensis]|uniref:PiggyBac transposable element-derived protein 4 n=1 Tax=Trichonephila inaurata madagascariensis TaxID=2747483 RepID=A0A8X7CFF4_9ARAC|nr:piggyBac transposable element-derived protein 4 [Trichonephila inaurata madagascariensis]
MPKFERFSKLAKGESEFFQNHNGTLATRWQDSKEVIVLSNCHLPGIATVERTQRDGKKEKTECPVAIADYNKIMGGVELSDQKVSLYDFDRKSTEWWKKSVL